jgi:hypothetical protein
MSPKNGCADIQQYVDWTMVMHKQDDHTMETEANVHITLDNVQKSWSSQKLESRTLVATNPQSPCRTCDDESEVTPHFQTLAEFEQGCSVTTAGN